jgi:hypothetical protein
MPTCRMKLTPLRRNARSSSGDMPSTMEGAWSSSSSVKIHCSSAWTTAGGGGRGRSRTGGAGLAVVDAMAMSDISGRWWLSPLGAERWTRSGPTEERLRLRLRSGIGRGAGVLGGRRRACASVAGVSEAAIRSRRRNHGGRCADGAEVRILCAGHNTVQVKVAPQRRERARAYAGLDHRPSTINQSPALRPSTLALRQPQAQRDRRHGRISPTPTVASRVLWLPFSSLLALRADPLLECRLCVCSRAPEPAWSQQRQWAKGVYQGVSDAAGELPGGWRVVEGSVTKHRVGIGCNISTANRTAEPQNTWQVQKASIATQLLCSPSCHNVLVRVYANHHELQSPTVNFSDRIVLKLQSERSAHLC